MAHQLKIKDLVEFVVKNRRGEAFKDWSEDELAINFRDGIDKNCLTFSLDEKEEIDGVLLAEIFPEYKVLHIENFLTTRRGLMNKFLSKYFEWYPGWELQANRHGHLIRYKDTPRLIQKIQN